MIIEGGSCENMISQEVVDKRNMKTKDHSHPYKLSWFKKGNKVKVTKRCLVSFSIRKKYFDEVMCDVVPMDACHISLGRPWQYDRQTLHDGKRNTYTISKEKQQYTLLPMEEKVHSKPTTTSLLTSKGFMKESHECGCIYVLILQEGIADFEIPKAVEGLLESYVDVFPQELPPMRDIQHCIDLVPGSSLPNKAAYRITPKEKNELQRQVGKLLDRGYIRVSLSPSVVPSLLTPKNDGS